MKRIGIDAHMLGDCSGGNETYYRGILENLEVPEGVEIFVFVKKNADISKIKDKFNIVYFSEHGAAYRVFIELPILCKKYKLDLLHVQYFIPFIRPCKIAVTIHDICFEHYKDIFTWKEYLRQKLLIPYAARKSVKIVTDSEFSKNDIISTYNIEKEKIVVSYCAASDEFKPLDEQEINRADLKERFDISDNYILTVGNLQPRKNIPRLIKAFELLCEEYNEPIQLVIVGKKAWLCEDIFKSVDLSKCNIVLTGYVEESELIRMYNAAKCFIYPSLFEGFGLPVIEAMSCGTPVVVSDSSSLPEVAGEEGIYFDPTKVEDIKDALLNCITEMDDSSEKTPKVYDRLKIFNWKQCADVVLKMYLEL